MPIDTPDDILSGGLVPRAPKPRPSSANYDSDTALNLISQHESGGRNIKQQVVPPGGGYNPSVGRVTGPSTAGGPWQITNTTWRKRAPREIAQKYPTAMSAPVEVQREVARKMFSETGFQDWAPYNASLRKAISRGEQPSQKPQNQEPSILSGGLVTKPQTPAQPKSYDTVLSPQEESSFQQWKQQYAPKDSGADYDLRGAFKAGLKPDPRTGHWPDTFKKPNHPSFSVESQYAVGADAVKAGRWEKDNFIAPQTAEPDILKGGLIEAQEPIKPQPSWASSLYNRQPTARSLQGAKVKPMRPRYSGIESGVQGEEKPISVGVGARQGNVPTAGDTVRAAGRVAMRSTDLGRVLPESAQDAIGEQVAKGTSGLLSTASGVIKTLPRQAQAGMRAPAPIESATRTIRAPINELANTLGQGGAEMAQQANRNIVSQAAQDIGGGAIASSPAFVLQSLGVPAAVAFGLDSYLKAEGRDADWKDVIKETGLGAASGALFDTPLPRAVRQRLLAQIGARLGIVGGGTFALEKIAGVDTKEAAKNAAVNALFAGAGARREIKPAEAIPASKPREFAPTLSPSELGKRTALREGGSIAATDRLPNVSEDVSSIGSAGASVNEPQASTGTNQDLRRVVQSERVAPIAADLQPKLREGVPSETKAETQPNITAQPEMAATRNNARTAGGVDATETRIGSGESTPRHVDLQPRRVRGDGKGQFKTETRAQREERLAQVNPLTVAEPWQMTRAEFESSSDVAHHGTDAEFDAFDINKGKKWGKFGLWFAGDKSFVETFGGNIKSAKLDIKNPKVIPLSEWDAIRRDHAKDAQWFAEWKRSLISQGYDGLKIEGKKDRLGGYDVETPTQYAAFDNSQVVTHQQAVERAVAEGRPVPPEVLADYPDLVPPSEGGVDQPPVYEPFWFSKLPEPTGAEDAGVDLVTGAHDMVLRQWLHEALTKGEQAADIYSAERGEWLRSPEGRRALSEFTRQPGKIGERARQLESFNDVQYIGDVDVNERATEPERVGHSEFADDQGNPSQKLVDMIRGWQAGDPEAFGYKGDTSTPEGQIEALTFMRNQFDRVLQETLPGGALEHFRPGAGRRLVYRGTPSSEPRFDTIQSWTPDRTEARDFAEARAKKAGEANVLYRRVSDDVPALDIQKVLARAGLGKASFSGEEEIFARFGEGSRGGVRETIPQSKSGVSVPAPETKPSEPVTAQPVKVETPIKPTSEPLKPEPSITSARKSQMASDRAELDLPELPPTERKSWRTSLDNAKPEKAGLLADEVLTKPRALNDEETASLVVRAQQIKNDHARVMKEIGDATSPEVITQKRAEADALENEFDRLTRATKASGTEKGRTLAAQKLTINKDFDLVSVKQRMKAAKGRELTPDESARYEKMVAERDQAIIDRDKAVEAARTAQLQREIGKVQRRRVRAEAKEALDTEVATIKSNIAAEFARLKSQQSKILSQGGLGNLDPDGVIARELVKYARNRVKANLEIKAAQLIDDVHELVKGFTDKVTRREIAELISGYKMSPPERKPEDVRRLAEIRGEIQKLLGAEDVAAGIRAPSREGPTKGEARQSGIPLQGPKRSDVARLPMEGPRLGEKTGRADIGPREREGWRATEGPRLSEGKGRTEGPRKAEAMKLPAEGVPRRLFGRNQARLKQLQKQEAELSRRLEQSDFSKPVKSEPLPYTREVIRAQDRVTKLESEFKREEARASGKLFWQNLSGIRKSWMLSGLTTQARNIGGTGAYQVFDEVSRMPAVIADAAIAPITGQRSITGPSPVKALDSALHAMTVGGREALETMKHGAPREQLERQQLQEINTGVKAIDTVHNAIFRFMSASDRVFYQGAYKRNLLDRARVQAMNEGRGNVRQRTREIVENPSEELQAAAKHDALVNTFNNNNRLSDAIKRGRGALTAPQNFAVDLILPFDRTPTNVIARVLEASPAGLWKAANRGYMPSLKVAKDIIRRSMSVEDQRQFAQTFGRATTGTALMGLGWYLAKQGTLESDDFGNVMLNVRGHKINLSAVSPLGTILGVGANLYYERSKPEPSLTGQMKAVSRPLLDQPLLRASSQATEFLRDPQRSASKTAASLAFTAVPFSGAVRDASKLTKEEGRWPKTFSDRLKSNVPILNRSIPMDRDWQRKQALSDLTERARGGEKVRSEADRLVNENVFRPDDYKDIERNAKQTPTQVRFRNKDLKQAVADYEGKSEPQRRELRDILAEKAMGVDLLRLDEQQDIRQRLVKLGFKPGLQIPKRPERPDRPARPNPRAWSVAP